MKKRIAKSAVSKNFPFDIKKIKLKDIAWDVDDKFTSLTLEKCNLPYIDVIAEEKIGFGFYAFAGNSEAFLQKEIEDRKTFHYLLILLKMV